MRAPKTSRSSRLSSVSLVAVGCALAVTGSSSRARAADTWTDPFPGVRRLQRVTSSQNVNVLKVDLCADGVSLRATKRGERGKTVSSFAQSVGAHAAVNGDFFVSGFRLERGIAAGDGQAWLSDDSQMADDPSVGQLAIGKGRIELIPDFIDKKALEPWMQNVVGGRPSLLVDGKNADTSGHPQLCPANNPRTAVGLTKDKRYLFIAVVDGRASNRAGMTCGQVASLMRELGAHDAMGFDGGGSTAMWIKGKGIVNFPSDGSERTVANHLALYATGSGAPTSCPLPKHPTKLESATCDDGIRGWVSGDRGAKNVALTFDATPGTSGAKVTISEPAGTCNDTEPCERPFAAPIPEALRDGRAHTVSASVEGDPDDVFDGSPATFQCDSIALPGDDAGFDVDVDTDGGAPPSNPGNRLRPPDDLDESSGCTTTRRSPNGLATAFVLLTSFAIVGVRRLRRGHRS